MGGIDKYRQELVDAREQQVISAVAALLHAPGSNDSKKSPFDDKKVESIKQLDEADRRLEIALAKMGEIKKRIDELEEGGFAWHDYGAFNALAITARENGKRGGRPRKSEPKTQSVTQPETESETQSVTQGLTGTEPVAKQSESESESKSLKKKEPPAEALGLAAYLRDSILSHYAGFKSGGPTLTKWATDIDKAIRLDERSPTDLRRVIDYAHRSDAGKFWRSNIKSGGSLREKFDTLMIQLRESGTAPPVARGNSEDRRRAEAERFGVSEDRMCYDAATDCYSVAPAVSV